MTRDPETNEEHQDEAYGDDEPLKRGDGEDPDSPGATIDDAEPAEPNEPG